MDWPERNLKFAMSWRDLLIAALRPVMSAEAFDARVAKRGGGVVEPAQA